MTTHSRAIRNLWIAFGCVAALAGCKGLGDIQASGDGGSPTPTPSTSASPTPGACSTEVPGPPANLVIVAIANGIGPTTTSKYGTINGYAVANNNVAPGQAQTIAQYASGSQTLPITTNNIVQFENFETTAQVNHSAVGFKGGAFPAIPHAFPSPVALPTGSTINDATTWSTGRIAASIYSACFSPPLRLQKGTYYFGDLDYYNLTNVRDVIIVGTPTPAPR